MWLGGAAMLLAWLLPNHYPPWTSFHGDAAGFAAVCLLCLGRSLQPRPAPLGAWMALPLALIALIALQWYGGLILFGGDALLSALFIAGAALAAWLGTSAHDQRRPDPLVYCAALFIAGAAISTLLGVLQWLRMEEVLGTLAAARGDGMRVISNMGQPNHFGVLCVMGAVLAIWLGLQGHVRRWQCVALLAWLALGLALSESRGALAAAVAAGALLLWSGRRITGLPQAVLAWWAFIVAGFALLPRLAEVMLLASARGLHLQEAGLRITMWRQALAAIEAEPWLGYGWRQSLMALKAKALHAPGHLTTDYAHNGVLDLLVWVGVPLGLLLLGVLAWWLLRAWWRIADTRQLFLLAAIVPFLAHSALEFPFAYAYFLFPVAWMAGTLGASQAAQRAQPAAAPRRDARLAMFAAAAAFAGLGVAIALEYLQAEEDYRVMRFELRKVGQTPAGYEAPDLVLLTQLKAMLTAGRLSPKPAMAPETVRQIGAVSARSGWATLDLTYAASLGLNGQPAEAERQLLLLQAVYGKETAKQAFDFFRAFQAKHPELQKVRVP